MNKQQKAVTNIRASVTGRATAHAFTLVELMTAVFIIGILVGIAFPLMYRSRENAHRKSCTGNLRRIEFAKNSYIMANNKPANLPESSFPETILFGVNGYLSVKPLCPAGGQYKINDGQTVATCDYQGGGIHHIDDD